LTFYSVAAGLSLCLCLVLLIFARFQPGTLLIRSWALAVTLLSIGFFAAGFAQLLPTWTMVVCANLLLLSAGPVLYSGFSSYCTGRKATLDRAGWMVVALTLPAFWYWGLIEPDGRCRSMVFSLATAAINCRTAFLLGRCTFSSIPAKFMALFFATLTVWMSSRFFVLLLSEPVSPDLRGANPTGWMTVFGYIILMSLMSVCVMWMEVNRLKEGRGETPTHSRSLSGFVEYFRNKLLLLWTAITVLIFGVVSIIGIGYVNIRETEKGRMTRSTELINDAFVEHTLQITGQVDTILLAVRGFYLRTRSITETEPFIRSLGFDRSVIDNIYLIAPDGRVIISHDPATLGLSMADRDYFTFHRATTDDLMFISSVEKGRVTGKHHFRITRRIDNPDGSFGGLVLATVNPESISRYYQDMRVGSTGTVSLIGIQDRKLRARLPELPVERWQETIDSPLWDALKKEPAGRYEHDSYLDGIRRIFLFKKVGALPLVMVTGFSNEDMNHAVRERMKWLLFASSAILLFTLLLALVLTIEAKRRDDGKKSEELLRNSEQRLREAQTIGRIGDWEMDLSTGIVNYSHQIYEMSGRTPATMPLTFAGILLATHPDDVAELERTFLKGIADATEEQMDARHISPDGSVKWFRYLGKPVCDGSGKVVKVRGTTQDIGKDKMMELEFKTLNVTLQQRVEKETEIRIAGERLLLQRSKQADMGEMIGAIAHQWRQPLSTVGVIFQNLLAARRMNKLDEAYLEKAATDATALITHMSKTIDSFRNFFKPEKSKERFNVMENIKNAADFIHGQLRSLSITIVLVENTDPDCTVEGFPNEFAQVILNLLANARDAILDKRHHNADGDDIITVTAQRNERLIVIQVTDTGCGIPPAVAARLFEPYYTTKEEGQGTGIGLYMSRQIIEESMGGRLTFTSNPGETIFRIEVPNA